MASNGPIQVGSYMALLPRGEEHLVFTSPVAGPSGEQLVLHNGDTLELEYVPELDRIVGRIKHAPGPIRRAWRRFALWTIKF